MVMVLLLQLAVTPVGSPLAAPIPVAPVVAIVMVGDKAVLIQRVLGDGAAAVLRGVVFILFVAVVVPHSFVTLTPMVLVPALLKTTVPGFWVLAVAGVALEKVQL